MNTKLLLIGVFLAVGLMLSGCASVGGYGYGYYGDYGYYGYPHGRGYFYYDYEPPHGYYRHHRYHNW